MRDVGDVIERAGADAAAGRYAAAIEALTETNRRGRDIELEQRLVDLRHEAFGALSPQDPVPGPLLPPCDDLFSEVDGIPEIEPSQLSSETVVSAIVHHGGLIVRRLFPDEIVERLLEDVAGTIDAVDRSKAQPGTAPDAAWFRPFAGAHATWGSEGRLWAMSAGTVWGPDSPRTFFDLVEAVREVGLRDTIASILGPDLVVSASKCAMRRVNPDMTAHWHQDSFLGADTRTVNAWITLSDCGLEAPGLDVLPRRIDYFLEAEHPPPLEFVIGDATVEALAADCPVVRPNFEAGDVMLFDQFLVHRTGWGPGLTKPRYGFECWFFEPSTFPAGNAPLVV